MSSLFRYSGIFVVGIVIGFLVAWYFPVLQDRLINPLVEKREPPLAKFAFPTLRKRAPNAGNVSVGDEIRSGDTWVSREITITTDGKPVSGMITLPKEPGQYPVIVMFRGFVPRSIFETGVGTRHGAEAFAQNGFIALAPDFLGFGRSASASADSMQARFETYTTAIDTVASVPLINSALARAGMSDISADSNHIGLWGHSNGGQITLSVLAIMGKPYPTVLWNPVSKPFPYNVLYYTDEYDDDGKSLRRILASFESEHDAEQYSMTNYFSWIKAPIQLHQAEADEAVPLVWSNTLNATLEKNTVDVEYFTYPNDDHNFSKGSWEKVVERNIEFYRKPVKPLSR